MVGSARFELTNAGVKVPCLTTWRRPIIKEKAVQERACTVCAYVQTEAIPAAGTGEPTDPAKPEQQGKPSGQTESPQTGDSSDMALWISLMLASCGGVLGMLLYRRKKAAAGK